MLIYYKLKAIRIQSWGGCNQIRGGITLGEELYKIIFVEDEEPLRKAICKVIDWEKFGFELVFEASSGEKAIEFTKKNKVDVLLTDICMPLMDGLELSRIIRQKFNSIKIIFLTGYDEFEYVQQALELKATKYILKPITPSEFQDFLEELKKELDGEINQKRNIQKYKQLYFESQKVLKKKELLDLVTNRNNNIEILSEKLGVVLKANTYIAAVIVIEKKEKIAKEYWENDLQLLEFAIYNVCDEILAKNNQDLFFWDKNGSVVIIFKEEILDEMVFKDYCIDVVNEIKLNIERIFEVEISIGIGCEYESTKKIHCSYQDAITALEYRTLLGRGKVIIRSEIEINEFFAIEKTDDMLNKLVHFIKIGEMDKVIQHLDYMMNFIKYSKVDLADFKTVLFKITTTMLNTFNEEIDGKHSEIVIDFNVFNQVFEKNSMGEIKEYYLNLCKQFMNQIDKKSKDDQGNLVGRASNYIYINYSNKDLDVQSICDYLHISPSYFSRLFKSEKKETIIEFLTRIRMEKSKELLKKTSMKVFEISEAVGYEDTHYFSYNFKKHIGITPTEYRKGRGVNF